MCLGLGLGVSALDRISKRPNLNIERSTMNAIRRRGTFVLGRKMLSLKV